MKKIVLIILTVLLVLPAALFAEGKDFSGAAKSTNFNIDAGAGLSVGFLSDTDTGDDSMAGVENFLTIMSTLRGAAYGQFRYNVSDFFSTGVNVGVYAITYSSGVNSVTIIDFPFHLLARLDYENFGIEGFGGYYLSAINTTNFSYSGLELGAKVILGGVYMSGSRVFSTKPYTRVEFGYELCDLFGF